MDVCVAALQRKQFFFIWWVMKRPNHSTFLQPHLSTTLAQACTVHILIGTIKNVASCLIVPLNKIWSHFLLDGLKYNTLKNKGASKGFSSDAMKNHF